MKKIIICFLLSICVSSAIYGQEIYLDINSQDTCLFLGGIVDGERFKVIENGNVVFKKAEDLTQVDLLTGSNFTDELFKQNLCFELEGYEPFWKVTIFRDNLIIWLPDEDDEKQYKIRLYINEGRVSSDFFAMFSTECGNVFGAINYVGAPRAGERRVCEYNLSDEDSLYEAYISIHGKAHKGCATIRKYAEL